MSGSVSPMRNENPMNLSYPTWAFEPKTAGWSLWRVVWKLSLIVLVSGVVLYGILWLIAIAIS